MMFHPEHNKIIRDMYPMIGSKGVHQLLPQFSRKQINFQAHKLGVKVDFDWRKKLAEAKKICKSTKPPPPKTPAEVLRLCARDIYCHAFERLAYTERWVGRP